MSKSEKCCHPITNIVPMSEKELEQRGIKFSGNETFFGKQCRDCGKVLEVFER